jgi:hypothetical protein
MTISIPFQAHVGTTYKRTLTKKIPVRDQVVSDRPAYKGAFNILTRYRPPHDNMGRCCVSQSAQIASGTSYFVERDGGSAQVYELASMPTITSSNLGERHAVCRASASFLAVIFSTTLLLLSASIHFNA